MASIGSPTCLWNAVVVVVAGPSLRISATSQRRNSSSVSATVHHSPMHRYKVRPRNDKRGVDLISDALPSRLNSGKSNSVVTVAVRQATQFVTILGV